jgi:hypothetical protein
MRRSFDGLAAMVTELIGRDPLSGHLFLFRNRRRDCVKILHWDGDGLVIWYKRLEEGTFELPGDGRDSPSKRASHESSPAPGAGGSSDHSSTGVGAGLEIRASELALLLGGIELSSVRRRPRYARASVG